MTTWFHEIRRASSVLQLIKEALQRSGIDISEFQERSDSSGGASLYLQRGWCIVEVAMSAFHGQSPWRAYPGPRPFLKNVSIELVFWFMRCYPLERITITYDATTTEWWIGTMGEGFSLKPTDLEPIKTKGFPWKVLLPYIENAEKRREPLEKKEALSLINSIAQIAAIPRDAKTKASRKNRGKRLRKYLRKRPKGGADHGGAP